MIDFHSHVLPGIDDGAKNTAESIALLEMLSSQGIDTVIATPHFYPDVDNPDHFFNARSASAERLSSAMTEHGSSLPKVALGAEVRYYDGISRMDCLERFCIEGTGILLLEMPFHRWGEHMMREVKHLASSGRVNLMMAHIERYLPHGCEGSLKELLEMGVIMQTNASHIIEFSTRRRAVKQLRQSFLHVLGSDCHSVARRPPRLGEARDRIIKKLGESFLDEIDCFGRDLLGDKLSCL